MILYYIFCCGSSSCLTVR